MSNAAITIRRVADGHALYRKGEIIMVCNSRYEAAQRAELLK